MFFKWIFHFLFLSIRYDVDGGGILDREEMELLVGDLVKQVAKKSGAWSASLTGSEMPESAFKQYTNELMEEMMAFCDADGE